MTPQSVVIERSSENPSEADVRDALARVRSSRTFGRSERLLLLLTFLVNATLEGDAAHLKETIIAISVCGRSPDYNPKADAIVRSQAWRLRAKLREYYDSEGSADPVVITLHSGRYVPTFSFASSATGDDGAPLGRRRVTQLVG